MKMKVISKNKLVLEKQIVKIFLLTFVCLLFSASPGLAQENFNQEGFAPHQRNSRSMNREQGLNSKGGQGERGQRLKNFQERKGKNGEGNSGRLMRMSGYLSFVEKYFDTIEDPRKALALTAMNIKQDYKKQGKLGDAAKLFEEALEATSDPQTRNVLLFTLRQVYEESKNSEKVSELDQQIFKENLKAVEKK